MAKRKKLKLDDLAIWAWEYAKAEMIDGPRKLSRKTIRFVAALSTHTLLLALWQLKRISMEERRRVYPYIRAQVYSKLVQDYGR